MWRDTALVPKFFFIDATSLFTFAVFVFHMSKKTFLFSLISCVFFVVLSRKRVTPLIVFRILKVKISGSDRPTSTDRFILRRRVKW